MSMSSGEVGVTNDFEITEEDNVQNQKERDARSASNQALASKRNVGSIGSFVKQRSAARQSRLETLVDSFLGDDKDFLGL